jgi:hypothetical protein
MWDSRRGLACKHVRATQRMMRGQKPGVGLERHFERRNRLFCFLRAQQDIALGEIQRR